MSGNSQQRVWDAIRELGKATRAEIGERLSMPASCVSAALSTLRSRGLVQCETQAPKYVVPPGIDRPEDMRGRRPKRKAIKTEGSR